MLFQKSQTDNNCYAATATATILDDTEQRKQCWMDRDVNSNQTLRAETCSRSQHELFKLAVAFRIYGYQTSKRIPSLACQSGHRPPNTQGSKRKGESSGDEGLESQIDSETVNIECNDPLFSSLNPCPGKEAPAPVVASPGSNKCLICREDDCRGNLYCKMLPVNDNDGGLMTLNRKKSVVQNRRKSALQGDGLTTAANEGAGNSEVEKSGNDSDRCSISQSLYSKPKSPTRTSHHPHSVETCQFSRLSHASSLLNNDNEANRGNGPLNCSYEFLDLMQSHQLGNYSDSDISSKSGGDAGLLNECYRELKSLSRALKSRETLEEPMAPLKVGIGTEVQSCRVGLFSSACQSESKSKLKTSQPRSSKLSPSKSSSASVSTKPKSISKHGSRSSFSPSAPPSFINGILWFIVSTILLNLTLSLVVSGAQSNEVAGSASGVCTSIDIRNKAQQLQNLTGCRVIEGFLVITLMDESNQTDFENFSFPNLTEITDFLLLYRVSGIRSLAKLFPNLTAIRGNHLFEGFALVIFENANMEEIGLTSLTTIIRGGVRIEKNPALCFVHTIDWNRIAISASPETLVFKHNKATNECPSCWPGKMKGEANGDCTPVANKRFCWNQTHCQKICPPECGNRACNSQGKCCNETCLGDCSADGNKCTVCRHLVAYGRNGEKRCVQECPANTYKHMNRRCVTKEECIETAKPLRSNYENKPYVPFEGECMVTCKSGYEKVNNTCVPCHNKCSKQCDSMVIFSIHDAESLRGCTIITGNLMINIRQGGPHLVEDLETALSSIEEIDGYLKIIRTYSIVSLSFFRRLRVIHGKSLDESKYALYVLDNQNLQNLWAENQNVTIERGRIFFHFNPKLCYNKIEALKPFIKENNTFDVAEVARDSNGDRVACDIQELIITKITPSETAAMLTVQPISFDDQRVFLGYQYFYMEAPFQNVSIYENRHGCGYDSWKVDDDNNKDHMHLFTHLKPYTQYAVYVKTYTIASEKKGGQSKIKYFRTLPSTPDPVRNLEFNVLNYSSIEIKWLEPREPKGNLTAYHLSAEITYDNPLILEQRNYCTEPIKETTIRARIPEEPKKPTIANEESCRAICKDLERPSKPLEESPDRENAIDFEDAIQNFVYIRRVPEDDQKRQKRSARSIDTNPANTLPQQSDDDEHSPREVLRKVKTHGSYEIYGESVNASTKSFIFTDLKHYSTYKIYVRACREGEGKNCSMETRIYPRTAKKDGADDIQNLTTHIENINNTRNNVRLSWKEPPNPNGLIVSYSIKYYRVDIEHAKHVDKCITYREYKNSTKGYILYDLDSGNYSVQVMATSLAGDGNYCKPVYFYIKESRLSWQIITLICVSVLAFFIIVGFIIWHFRRRWLRPPDDLKLFTSVNPEYISMQYTPDEWEIPREKIIQIRELGQGSFGMVYEGMVKNLSKDGEDIPCAIKTVNENATDRERINFLKEASVMKAFDTYHVVHLLGVVSRDQPTLVIMELMTNGDLKGYLRSNRPDSEQAKSGEVQVQPPTLKRILQMAIEIADGMAYLSAKKFVHRDLAARNCMVAEDLTVKIGDFGMTRDIYETDYYRKGTKGLLPVRWMAPESLKDGVFSSSSDVFSYGVVLWEMATLASQPYQGLSNDQVLRYVIDGGVMERPENCPDKLYNLMRRCWQHRPSARPTFMEIIEHLLDDANQKFHQVSFFHSPHGQDLYKQMQTVTDIDDTTPLRMGDDDFKLDVGENYLMDRTDSHLVPEEPQHSPYSFGSGIAINNIPDGTSKQNNENNSPSRVITNNKNKDTASTITTAATVQSFSNSLVPPRFRRMWRNAFLGNGNSNYSNRSCNGGGGGTAAAATEAGTSSEAEGGAKALGTGSNSGGGSNSGSGVSSGLSGIFSGLMGFGHNGGSGNSGNSRSLAKDFTSKGNQKMSQETITNPLLNDISFDEITSQSLTNVSPNSRIPCNHNDSKVKSSSLSSSNRSTQLPSTASTLPYQKQPQKLDPENPSGQQWLYSNGFLPTNNPTTPLLSSGTASQPHRVSSGKGFHEFQSQIPSRPYVKPGTDHDLTPETSDNASGRYTGLQQPQSSMHGIRMGGEGKTSESQSPPSTSS